MNIFSKRQFLKFLEVLLDPFIGPTKKKQRPKEIKKIALFEVNGLGDHVSCMGALERLKKAYPQSEIIFICAKGMEDLYKDFDVSSVLPITTYWTSNISSRAKRLILMLRSISLVRNNKFDLIIDTRGDLRRTLFIRLSKPRLSASLDGFMASIDMGYKGILNNIVLPRNSHILRRNEEANHLTDLLIKKIGNEKKQTPGLSLKRNRFIYKSPQAHTRGEVVILHLGAGWEYRLWSIEKWVQLSTLIKSNSPGLEIVILEGPGEKQSTQLFLDLLPQPNQRVRVFNKKLSEVVALMHKSKYYIGCDSGPLHLASACGLKTIGLYGPGNLSIWTPANESGETIIHQQNSYACAPCAQRICLYPDNNCVKTIQVQRVLNMFLNLYKP